MRGTAGASPGIAFWRKRTNFSRFGNFTLVVRAGAKPCRLDVMSVNGTVLPAPPQATTASGTAMARLEDVDRFAVRVRRIELRREPHRDAHAAMARRIGRYGRIPVDGRPAGEVP